MNKEENAFAPSGWYPDPDGNLRYWDGKSWLNIPSPPGRAQAAQVSESSFVLGPDFRLEVGMSIFVGRLQDLFDWPITDNAVIDFCNLIIEDSDISNKIGLVDIDSNDYGNPRIDPSHLNSYLWALCGILFADYFDGGIQFENTRDSSRLDWNTFRKYFRNAQREKFASSSFFDDEYAPVDFYIRLISINGQNFQPQSEALSQLISELNKAKSNFAVNQFLQYFNSEIQEIDLLDESLIKYLWTEIVISLPKIMSLDLDSIRDQISQCSLNDEGFDWQAPAELPWLIQHNRKIKQRLEYSPWPWTNDSRGIWNDDIDSFYLVERLEATQPKDINPSIEQQLATFSSLILIGKAIEPQIPQRLSQFIEDNNKLLYLCFEEMSDQWTMGEEYEYSLPQKGALRISEKSLLAKKIKKAWPGYIAIIRDAR